MTLYEFQELPRRKQIETLWDFGIEVDERESHPYLYVLYNLYSFYVELKYLGESLITIYAFNHTDPLDPYLNNIVIPSIDSNNFS
jgi:hypothetical protein